MTRLRQRKLYPPQNFRRKLLNYLGINNRGVVSRPSPGQFTITKLRPRVGLTLGVKLPFLAGQVPYYVHKGKNGMTHKYFAESDFTPDVVARLNASVR